MKGTILYAEYDEGTGVSVVTKQTKYGTFTRSVRVHQQDEDIANQYDGCYFAELKCDIAAYQERAKFMRERAKGITHAFNVLSHADAQSNPYMDEIAPEWYLLAHQADLAWRDAEQAFEKDNINVFTDIYIKIPKKSDKNKKKNNGRRKN